jgi:DNA-directed RNA polymerase specialized sigma24 family protein
VVVRQSEVVVARQWADAPGFDEYVVARGSDLLRTAWLLAGDEEGAHALARTTLDAAYPQWSQLVERGAGSYDAELRRALVRTYLHRPRRRHPDPAPGEALEAGEGRGSRTPAAWRALDGLPRHQRAVVALAVVDGLGDAQVAQVLDETPTEVRRLREHALSALAHRLGVSSEAVGDLLADLVPADPPVDRLLGRPVRSRTLWRSVRDWVAVLAGLAVVALVVGLVGSRHGGGDVVPPPPDPTLEPLTCRTPAPPPSPPEVSAVPVRARYVAVLVCAQTDEGSVWQNSLPPDDPVTAPQALDALVLEPRGGRAHCPALPAGPAFRVLLRGVDGDLTTWANEGLACNGWPALAFYYRALAEQGAGPSVDPDGFLGCPSVLGWRDGSATATPGATATAGLPRGTVLTEATACLHPAPQLQGTTPSFRAVRGAVLGAPGLAQLNADLAAGGSRRGPRLACSGSPWTYVLRARTTTGRVVELTSGCAREFAIDGHPHDTWPVSRETTSMLRAVLVAN